MASQPQTQPLHILLTPLMSQSHLIPFTDMATLLARRGVTVSVLMTPLNAARFSHTTDHAALSGLKIHFIVLPFPSQQAGLPAGCENMDLLPSGDLVPNFFHASNLLQEPLERWIGEQETKISCIIADICFPWTEDLAAKFKIPRYVYHGVSCFTLLCTHNISHHNVMSKVGSENEAFLVPDVPDKIELTLSQVPEMMRIGAGDKGGMAARFKSGERSAQGVLVNSFEELESEYVKGYEKIGRRVWCIGPVSLCDNDYKAIDKGNKACVDESLCMEWLDSMKPRSVVYVCFGSLCNISTQQLVEIGLGLEGSNHPFIWVIKGANLSIELEKWLQEERYEERVRGKGVLIRGWAPQVVILSHPAVGGFLTHCGWNSTLEGVSAGVPMITWPMFAEQFFNEKVIVQVLKIGVGVGAEKCMERSDEKGVVLVKREGVERAIEEVMGGGEEGEERRKRARELGEIAKRAIKEDGSSYLNMSLLIQDIINQNSHEK